MANPRRQFPGQLKSLVQPGSRSLAAAHQGYLRQWQCRRGAAHKEQRRGIGNFRQELGVIWLTQNQSLGLDAFPYLAPTGNFAPLSADLAGRVQATCRVEVLMLQNLQGREALAQNICRQSIRNALQAS